MKRILTALAIVAASAVSAKSPDLLFVAETDKVEYFLEKDTIETKTDPSGKEVVIASFLARETNTEQFSHYMMLFVPKSSCLKGYGTGSGMIGRLVKGDPTPNPRSLTWDKHGSRAIDKMITAMCADVQY